MATTTLKTMVTDWIRVKTQGADPTAPAAGYGVFYDKSKLPYHENSDGTVQRLGDTISPATHSDSYIPQWDGVNTHTLKAGLDVPAGGLAGITALDLKAPIASPTFTGTVTGRIGPRVQSVADAATVTPNADTNDCVDITAIAQAFTIANASGTPANFQRLIIRIKDNGTARAITWDTAYVAGGVALPSITVLSKILTLTFMYNSANSLNKWQLIHSAQEA